MLTAIVLLLISLLALFYGAGWLVRGSSSMAIRAGISPFVIGFTIVALGTSMPELVISLNTALHGEGDIAIGNIIGSNIYNICIILGISIIHFPHFSKTKLNRFDISVMILSVIAFTVVLWNGVIERITGIAFLSAFIIYLFLRISFNYKATAKKSFIKKIETKTSSAYWLSDILFICSGMLVIIFASNILADNAVIIASGLKISNSAIALTIIAAGTSLPELATSFVALKEKDPGLAIGNVIGSNIINILGIAGVTATIIPIHSSGINHIDLLVLLGVSVLLLPSTFTNLKANKLKGYFLVLIYITYVLCLLSNVF